MTTKLPNIKSGDNNTTVKTLTIGNAIATVAVVVANQLGANIGGETAAILITALGVIVNYYIPVKKQG